MIKVRAKRRRAAQALLSQNGTEDGGWSQMRVRVLRGLMILSLWVRMALRAPAHIPGPMQAVLVRRAWAKENFYSQLWIPQEDGGQVGFRSYFRGNLIHVFHVLHSACVARIIQESESRRGKKPQSETSSQMTTSFLPSIISSKHRWTLCEGITHGGKD